jgi:predicted nucleotidyltransferase
MDAYAASLLAGHPEVEEIIVFGSFATHTHAPGSDLDLLIVLTHADRAIRDRIPDLLPRRFPVPVDLFPYTRAELAERAGSPIVTAASTSTWRYHRRAQG